ncbi:MAG: fluoride efflux transporter CrcB [Nitrososphaeraceae archaeon]
MKGIEFVLLAVGALAGTFLRYKIVSTPLWLGALPLNVLSINVLGSFALGVFSIITLTWNLDPKYSLLVAIGFCGSFTTMSSFALESSNLLDNKQFSIFGLNILANVGLSLGAVILGRLLTSTILRVVQQ